MSHKYVLLKEVCEKASSNIAQKDLAECDGIYPIYGASGYIKSVDFFQQAKDYIAIVKDGAGIGRAMKLPAKSSVIGTMQYVLPNDNINISYLYYAICSMHLEKYFSGATIPHIYFRDYQNEQLPLPTLEEQAKIANVFGRIDYFIKKEKEQLINLDKLVKSRFIEMFGDPLNNSQSLNSMPMTDVCYIIDGDRGKNYPTANDFYEDEHCLFLNAKNVTSNGFSFDSCMFITKEKDQSLRKGKLKRGDVVLTTRGTLGNLAYYTDDVPYENIRINSGMVILRMHKSTVNEVFFIEQFKMLLDDIKAKIASGSAQPQLPISTMNKIVMIIPEISEQNQFADFVAQVDKSKLAIQQSLDELETLKKSLMQQYFG